MLISIPTYDAIKEQTVRGRYVTLDHILPCLKKWAGQFPLHRIGDSVLGNPLYTITLGKGPKRILMWSQMHGNESTATKAILDLLGFMGTPNAESEAILNSCTLRILPMLNPDGAIAYTRVNANESDLNRDAQKQSQPESRALREAFDLFKPHYCFNLHDQRTIFNVGATPLPATMSFLAPAEDEARTISGNRKVSMQLIAAMDQALQALIPGRVGRYDDSFNLDCVGDTFQSLHIPTILFEAGHTPGDYEREQTRMYFFQALMVALQVISTERLDSYTVDAYFGIPKNCKQFLDVIVKNPRFLNDKWPEGTDLGFRYEEILRDNHIYFQPVIEEKGKLRDRFAHATFDCELAEDVLKLEENRQLLKFLK